MDHFLPYIIPFTGIDDSVSMLEKCRAKLDQFQVKRTVDLECANLNNGVQIHNVSVVILCLTLQFIRPMARLQMLKDIFLGLRKDGVLIVIEKVLAEDNILNRKFIAQK